PPARSAALHLDARALLFELRLERSGLVLRNTGLDLARGTVHQILRLLQAEAGDLANDLDHLDLLGASFLEHDGELRLLFGCGRGGGSCRRGTTRRGGGDGDVELFLESFDQLGELEDRHVADRVEDLVLAHGCVSHCRTLLGDFPRPNPGGRSGLRLGNQADSRCVRSASSAPTIMYIRPLIAPTNPAMGACSPAPSSASI